MSSSSVVSLDHSSGNALVSYVADLYDRYGQRKEMGVSAPQKTLPHFFLLRTFLGVNDLLVIFNTKRCRYRCAFCQLPAKSSSTWISDQDVVTQFRYVATELRHALSVIDRVTLSNDGSVLDSSTFGADALADVLAAVGAMRRVRHVELETRLEFVEPDALRYLRSLVPRARFGILTGFETQDARIRDVVLKKREPLAQFLAGLDNVARAGADLTAYVLFKPDPAMSDQAAYEEAQATASLLMRETRSRGISLTIRLNPMYRAVGSKWARVADSIPAYSPPRLTDVMRLAEWAKREGIQIYIGMSTEGLTGDTGTYMSRDDYGPALVKYVKLFNDGKIDVFPWNDPELSPTVQLAC